MMNKKSQLLILSTLYLAMFLVFIYSLETDNYYITHFEEYSIVENLKFETCYVVTSTNGTYLENKLLEFNQGVASYCSSFGLNCNFTATNITPIPSNESLINYSLYSYSLEVTTPQSSSFSQFTC